MFLHPPFFVSRNSVVSRSYASPEHAASSRPDGSHLPAAGKFKGGDARRSINVALNLTFLITIRLASSLHFKINLTGASKGY